VINKIAQIYILGLVYLHCCIDLFLGRPLFVIDSEATEPTCLPETYINSSDYMENGHSQTIIFILVLQLHIILINNKKEMANGPWM